MLNFLFDSVIRYMLYLNIIWFFSPIISSEWLYKPSQAKFKKKMSNKWKGIV